MTSQLKEFIWFTKNSWSYMQGSRLQFFKGFIPAWLVFHRLNQADKEERVAYRKLNWWQRNRPNLEFYFSLWPLIRVGTNIMRESIEMKQFEYCRLELWLFKKKLLAFNLYKREL